MLELYKRCWQIFIPAFVGLSGLAVTTWILFDDYRIPVTIILLILASVCLVIGIIAFVYDIKDARRKDKEAKAPSVYEKRGLISF